ncbi:MAG: hypothetical protein M1823_005891 [Watsoniomyces obsoletus]|nr:MAG: hypothetical protein M1823_005891 [Watsoniomyces obsoletus]
MGYHLTEPQASTPHGTSYVHTGRGGAGNFQASSKSSSSSTATNTSNLPPPPTTGRFLTGRGGTGNVHSASERPMFFFDEDMERLSSRAEPAPVIHVGRGGAGNWTNVGKTDGATASSGLATHAGHDHVDAAGKGVSTMATARKSRESGRSGGSGSSSEDGSGAGIWRRLSQTLHRV